MKVYRSQQLIRPDLEAHIYSKVLLENVRNLRSLCPRETKFCAVVKANAYGHGIGEIVNILKNADVDFFAVASIYEAVHIAELVKKQTILILEPINVSVPVEQVSVCAKNNFHCSISCIGALGFIAQILAGTKKVLNLHVNVETGMGRNGLAPDEAAKLIEMIDKCENTHLAGVYTHFATADEEDLSYAYQQLNEFKDFLAQNQITDRGDVLIHAANSAATIKMPDAHFDMVRCGISMYGYYSRQMQNPPIELKGVMKLQAPVVQLKKIGANRPVSYGLSYTTSRDTTTGILPLGYADSYWRMFSNRAKMKVGRAVVPVIGRVCMDQVSIDVTDIPDVSVGQMVTVIDNEHDSPCSVYALAELVDTICYEILTCVHDHVNRIVH